MTDKKIEEVLLGYEKFFRDRGITKNKTNPNLYCLDTHAGLTHLHAMIDEMRTFLKEGRREKVFRWLGFMQGVLWPTGQYTLNHLKNHSRPD